jgi:hypothetical protein
MTKTINKFDFAEDMVLFGYNYDFAYIMFDYLEREDIDNYEPRAIAFRFTTLSREEVVYGIKDFYEEKGIIVEDISDKELFNRYAELAHYNFVGQLGGVAIFDKGYYKK